MHLRLSKVEELFSDRFDGYLRDRLTKFTYPQTLSGYSVHNDRRRPVSGKFSVLWLSLADRRAERVVSTAWKDHRIEIWKSISFLVASANLEKSFSGRMEEIGRKLEIGIKATLYSLPR